MTGLKKKADKLEDRSGQVSNHTGIQEWTSRHTNWKTGVEREADRLTGRGQVSPRKKLWQNSIKNSLLKKN